MTTAFGFQTNRWRVCFFCSQRDMDFACKFSRLEYHSKSRRTSFRFASDSGSLTQSPMKRGRVDHNAAERSRLLGVVQLQTSGEEKNMNKDMVKKSEAVVQLKERVMDHLLKIENFTPQKLAKDLKLPISDTLALLSDDDFVAELHNKKLQVLRVFFNTIAIDELKNIVETGTPRDKINATKLLHEISGYREKAPLVAIQQNFRDREPQPGEPGWIESVIKKISRERSE
jgi:hypothetical protein